MNIKRDTKNLSPKKLKSYKLTSDNYKLSAFRNLPPTTYHLPPTRGFTLIEMLVSIAVFMVVMTVASGSLASIIDGNGKAQSLKSAVNNLNFAMENMEKNIRVGTDYVGGESCSPADTCIGFTSYKDSASDGNDFIVYRFNAESIERCVKPNSSYLISSCNATDYIRLTAPEVHIDYANFFPSSPSGTAKPRVLIVIGGSAGTKERIKTKFNLQTTVSQRQF
ncbi:MAG: type II secretion system protein [Patescibacteria group bacterium]